MPILILISPNVKLVLSRLRTADSFVTERLVVVESDFYLAIDGSRDYGICLIG